MAFKHGKAGAFLVDDSGGTLRDISAFVSGVDIELSVDVPETTTFGATAVRRQVVGLKDNSFTVTARHDTTATTGSWTVLTGIYAMANSVSFEWGPEGSTTGLPKISGEARLQSLSQGVEVDSVVPLVAQFVGDGAVTVGTFA